MHSLYGGRLGLNVSVVGFRVCNSLVRYLVGKKTRGSRGEDEVRLEQEKGSVA